MNIYQKLQAVMKEVAYIQKDATVRGGQEYKAVSHDMVTAKVRPYFVQHGIVVIPRLVTGAVVDTGRKTKADNPIIRYEGLYEVTFVNVDDPADTCVIPLSAHAEDQGDKAPGKAISYATKYAILKALQLETGESDEGRVSPVEEELIPLSEKELDGLKAQLNKATNPEALKTALQAAFTVCKKAGDHEAHGAIKAYATTLAANMMTKEAA